MEFCGVEAQSAASPLGLGVPSIPSIESDQGSCEANK